MCTAFLAAARRGPACLLNSERSLTGRARAAWSMWRWMRLQRPWRLRWTSTPFRVSPVCVTPLGARKDDDHLGDSMSLIVCPLHEVEEVVQRRSPSHVLSLLGPTAPPPAC